jgi:hypothetical protein
MTSSKLSQLIQILKESPLFPTLSAKDYDSLVQQMDNYPLSDESAEAASDVGYEASWLLISNYKKSAAAR